MIIPLELCLAYRRFYYDAKKAPSSLNGFAFLLPADDELLIRKS
jgi:hypothetical protein